jgi:hypothetical protein
VPAALRPTLEAGRTVILYFMRGDVLDDPDGILRGHGRAMR